MTPEHKLYFRNLFNLQKERIIHGLRTASESLREDTVSSNDEADHTAKLIQDTLQIRLRSRETSLLTKINGALKRLENGTFGVCEDCGDGIELARLKARPVTTLCILCKNAQERTEESFMRIAKTVPRNG